MNSPSNPTPNDVITDSSCQSNLSDQDQNQIVNDSSETLPEQVASLVPPIRPPSEALQYRAIGTVRGIYLPSADQFTRGTLLATDGTLIDAVLLGRVMSLVKNHLKDNEPHLWIVYPRTRQNEESLHVQIVGVWEPETLKRQFPKKDYNSLEVHESEFSIRGEVIFYSKEEDRIIVKIKQAPRSNDDKPKFFKLKLKGKLSDKPVGHFWEFVVTRETNDLVIKDTNDIAVLPLKRKPGPGLRRGAPGDSPRKYYSRDGGKGPRPPRSDFSRSSSTPTPKPNIVKPKRKDPPPQT